MPYDYTLSSSTYIPTFPPPFTTDQLYDYMSLCPLPAPTPLQIFLKPFSPARRYPTSVFSRLLLRSSQLFLPYCLSIPILFLVLIHHRVDIFLSFYSASLSREAYQLRTLEANSPRSSLDPLLHPVRQRPAPPRRSVERLLGTPASQARQHQVTLYPLSERTVRGGAHRVAERYPA